MHIQGVLLAGLILIAGCSKDKAAEPRPDPAPRGSGSAKPAPEPDVLSLVKAPEAVAQPVTARTAVLIAKDGSLSLAELEGAVLAGFVAADLKGEPVAQVADLAAKVTAMAPDPGTFDDTADVGTAMALDEGKMGKKDSDRAEGSYKMKGTKTPEEARAEAIAAAKTAGILAAVSDPCGGAFGGELGGEHGWGTIGVGKGYGSNGPVVNRAGLRAASTMSAAICGSDIPLVLADAGAPAARVVEVLSAFPKSQLAITTDGVHAATLAAAFTFLAGNRPASSLPEVGFTLRADGASGSAYRGATADATVWTWDGRSGGITEAFAAASDVTALSGIPVRIRLDGELTAGALIDAIATLLVGNATQLAIGEPIDHAVVRPGHTEGPEARLGDPTVAGELDKQVVRRYVRRHLPKIEYCYEKRLLSEPTLAGTVEVTWTIQTNGVVKGAKATGVSHDVSSCVADVIANIEFPKPKNGTVTVTYPLEFRPSPG